jgi:MFS transporter, ACS family, hexuronate transporter
MGYDRLAFLATGLNYLHRLSFNYLPAENLSAHFIYSTSYNTVFVGYGLIALTGLAIILFMTGPLVRDKDLQTCVDKEIV